MTLHPVDLAIIVAYFLAITLIGLRAARKRTADLGSYFLGSRSLPWYLLGVSDASGMFDISGTMWMIYALFVYGLKSIWLPFLWPVFNQIFLMVYLSRWVRRSEVLTGAEWIETRFGRGRGANLAHLSVVAFAVINCVGMIGYAFKGIGKFAVIMLPWHLSENTYAAILMGITALYAIKGGMFSVVATEVTQFALLSVTSIIIGIIALVRVSPAMIAGVLPQGWSSPFFGWRLGIDWTGILDRANDSIRADGNEWFGILFGFMLFKGLFAAAAGPAPTFDMQRILSARTPREASLVNGLVNIVLLFPRYLLIAGITVLGLAFCVPQLRASGSPDFEQILPMVLSRAVPHGLIGFLLAGLLAAFMSSLAANLNTAPAYLVNDIYKRYINPAASGPRQVGLSRLASLAVLLGGIGVGLVANRITDVVLWMVGALYSGFVIANVLKWYWWRFNGYGYFWGMISGIAAAVAAPELMSRLHGHAINPLFAMPVIFLVSGLGCLAGTLLTPPDEEAVLRRFYRTVQPWGAWGPIRRAVLREAPDVGQPNRAIGRDLVNITVGIFWQLALTALPIYLVLRNWTAAGGVAVLLGLTSWYLKVYWLDRLEADRVTRPAA